MEGLAAIGSAQRGTMWAGNPVSAASGGAETGDVSVASESAAYGNTGDGVSASFSKESLTAANASKSSGASQELTDEEKKEVEDLKKRDQEVRQHEQAHLAAGGQYVRGGASYTYTQGPDGKSYASGGEVSIDVSAERDPSATIRKMQLVERAALAPASPSPQDRSVAAQARQAASEAQAEVQKTSTSNAGTGNAEKTGEAKKNTAASAAALPRPALGNKTPSVPASTQNTATETPIITSNRQATAGAIRKTSTPFDTTGVTSALSGTQLLDVFA